MGKLLLILILVGYLITLEMNGVDECKKMMALAKTHSDTLTVYSMKPNSKTLTCAQRLR